MHGIQADMIAFAIAEHGEVADFRRDQRFRHHDTAAGRLDPAAKIFAGTARRVYRV